jgi:hypothetical protein
MAEDVAMASATPAVPPKPRPGLLDRLGHRLEHPAVLPGVLLAGLVFVIAIVIPATRNDKLVAYDAHAYYQAAALQDPYRATIQGGFDAVGGLYEFKYPPPLAQALAPFRLVLTWPQFLAIWSALLYAVFVVMGGRWALPLLVFPPLLGELWLGNINLWIAAAVWLGFRWPAAWAFIILTKITPGIGLLWFAVRREWRNLAIAIGATAAIAAVSFVLAPNLWRDFIEASRTQVAATVDVPRQAAPLSLPVRMIVGALIIVAGALTDRRWLVPVAVALTVPFLWWNVLAILIVCIPLAREDARRRREREIQARPAIPAPATPSPASPSVG